MGACKNRLNGAVLMSTHNLCFRAKIWKNDISFYYMYIKGDGPVTVIIISYVGAY